jgi:hypothetical protein
VRARLGPEAPPVARLRTPLNPFGCPENIRDVVDAAVSTAEPTKIRARGTVDMHSASALYSIFVPVGNVVRPSGVTPMPIEEATCPWHTHARSTKRGGNRWPLGGARTGPVSAADSVNA